MQTVGSFLGSEIRRNYQPVKELPDVGNIGIELELERGNFNQVKGWELHNDGSLRDGGVEYVFNGAQGGSVALDSIVAMGENLAKNKALPSFRCSTHIHLDARDLNLLQVAKYVSAYSIMEDVMFDHCDEYRRYSNFCVPFMVSDDLIQKFSAGYGHGFNSKSTWVSFGRYPKYSALNVQPLIRFGSIEFRGSHAMTTTEDLLGLAQRIMHLKRVVLESDDKETLPEFIEKVNKMHPAQLFIQGLRGDLKRNQELADLCYSNALMLHQNILGAAKGVYEDRFWQNIQAAQRGVFNNVQAGFAEPPEASWRVSINQVGYARYGLFAGGDTVTARDAKATLHALRRIRGIRVPDFATLYQLNDRWTEADIDRLMNYINE